MLKKVQFENNIRLQHLVFGYKIFDKKYFHLNYFLTILAFTIYKSYYVRYTVQNVPTATPPAQSQIVSGNQLGNTIISYGYKETNI